MDASRDEAVVTAGGRVQGATMTGAGRPWQDCTEAHLASVESPTPDPPPGPLASGTGEEEKDIQARVDKWGAGCALTYRAKQRSDSHMVVKVLFTGGTSYQVVEASHCVVGAAGELRFFRKARRDPNSVVVSLIIAPGQWRYADLDHQEAEAQETSDGYALAMSEPPQAEAAVARSGDERGSDAT